MNLITKNNYEAFLLDYVEGNLSPEHTAELMLFLENHPEFKLDIEDFNITELEPLDVKLDNKEELKITAGRINAINFEEAVIAEIEEVNTEKEKAALATYLKENPNEETVLEAYQKTRLVAPIVTFNFKENLKQEDKKVIPLYWWYSAAAAVILAVFLLNIEWNKETSVAPIADKLNLEETIKEVKKNEVKETSETKLINDEITVEQKEETNAPKKEQNKLPSVQPKVTIEKVIVEEVEKPNTILVKEEFKDVIKDSSYSYKEVEPHKEEEILYADDVKITYEDEPEPTNTSTNEAISKPSKFDVIRAAAKQQLNSFFNNAKKDAETLAASTRTLGFNRNNSEK